MSSSPFQFDQIQYHIPILCSGGRGTNRGKEICWNPTNNNSAFTQQFSLQVLHWFPKLPPTAQSGAIIFVRHVIPSWDCHCNDIKWQKTKKSFRSGYMDDFRNQAAVSVLTFRQKSGTQQEIRKAFENCMIVHPQTDYSNTSESQPQWMMGTVQQESFIQVVSRCVSFSVLREGPYWRSWS